MPTVPPTWRQRFWERFQPLPGWALSVVLLGSVCALAAPIVSRHDPSTTSLSLRFRPPVWNMVHGRWEYPLGTDHLGRDVLTRIVYGARAACTIGVLTVLLAGSVGTVVGLVARGAGGRLAVLLRGVVDTMRLLPSVGWALLFAVTLGPGWWPLVLALSLSLWTCYAQAILQALPRGATAAFRPTLRTTLLVQGTEHLGQVILLEATLSFLGAGVPSPTPAWGLMVAEGRDYLLRAWWVSGLPGVAIVTFVLALHTVGAWLRDRLAPQR